MRVQVNFWRPLAVLVSLSIGLAILGTRAAHAQSPGSYTVRADAVGCVRVRIAPRAGSAGLGCVYAGAELAVVGEAPFWWQVETVLEPRLAGWVPKRFVQQPVQTPSSADPSRTDAWLEVHFVDVGQGDAVWIRTFDDGIAGNDRYDGRNIVIDGGPDGSDQSNAFLQYLFRHAHEGAVIDLAILSHPHDDHYPGLQGLFRHFEITSLFESGFPKSGVKYSRFLGAASAERAANAPMRHVRDVVQASPPSLGSELKLEFLYGWPGADNDDDLGSASTLENNASVVVRLTYGIHSFLFMGDAEGKDRDDDAGTARYVERRLIDRYGSALRSTVLKVGHHGSETSSTVPFLEAVSPSHLVVMSGRRAYNGTFLPRESTLARICDVLPSATVLRTDQDDEAEGRTAKTDADGDHIVFRTNGIDLVVEAYSAGQRITPTPCAR